MSVTAVLGAQWGDEGKGKVVDLLAQESDLVIRPQGGNNAGHSIVNEYGKAVLHLVPSGIFSKRAVSIIGRGTVINPLALIEEILGLQKIGVKVTAQRLRIDPGAHLIMPWHILLDEVEENSRGENKIGTTKRGIGPCYADKIARKGIRIGDLLDPKKFRDRFYPICHEKSIVLARVYNCFNLIGSESKILDDYSYCAFALEDYIGDTEPLIWDAIEKEKNILLEGAQGFHLDNDFGTYPFVTSSACTIAGLAQGCGIPANLITRRIAVVNSYTTRVAAGPFPTEMPKEQADLLREHAQEYGATTGRPRRIGWFDAELIRRAHRVNSFTSAILTRLDNLEVFEKLLICYKYRRQRNGIFSWDRAVPLYAEMSGWQKDVSSCRDFSELPRQAQSYVAKIEKLIGVPIELISNGKEREAVIGR